MFNSLIQRSSVRGPPIYFVRPAYGFCNIVSLCVMENNYISLYQRTRFVTVISIWHAGGVQLNEER
jgi:hypothetical protein